MPFPLASVLEIGGKLIDRVIPDPKAAAEAKLKLLELQQSGELAKMNFDLEELKLQANLAEGQIEVNKVEAASGSFFQSGWRPAVGWVSTGGLAYQLMLRPLLGWATVNLWGWSAPPPLEVETLMTLLFGILGLGAYRTFERVKGTT